MNVLEYVHTLHAADSLSAMQSVTFFGGGVGSGKAALCSICFCDVFVHLIKKRQCDWQMPQAAAARDKQDQ